MTRAIKTVTKTKTRVTALTAVLVALGTAVGAIAYFTSHGSGTANASVGTLTAPGKPSTSVTGTTVHLSWAAASVSGGGTVKYHVERRTDIGSTWSDACSSTDAAPITGTTCDDSAGPGTFVYRVTARFVTWHSVGPESDPVMAEIVATKLVFITSPATTTAGLTSGTITIERQDASGNAGTAGNATISLASTSGAGVFRNTGDTATITTVSIPEGSSDASFKYRDTAAGTPTLTVSDTPDSLTQATQTATITPASATTLTVAGYPSPTTAGSSHGFTVTAKDPYGNTDTNYAGIVHLTSTDAQATLPANASLGAGTGSFNATLKTAGSQSITATDTATSSITGSQTGITITPAAATSLTVTGFPSPRTAGVAGSFSVTAKDPYGNTDTNYADTVHFTSSDAQAALPANSTLTSGTGSFNATLKTAGSQSITATDTVANSVTGSQTGITINSAGTSKLAVAGFVSPTTAGVAHSFTVTAQDQFGNTTPAYSGTVHFTSSDAQATLPANSTLTSGTGTFNATLKTAGSQSLTATDTVTSSITGSQTGITVTPATASQLAFTTQPGGATAGSVFTQQPVVKTQDPFGNNSTVGLGASRSVTVAIASGAGTLQGTATLDIGIGAGNGTVTFTNLRIDTAGAKTLSATAAAGAPTLTTATSNSFTVNPTTVSQLAFTTQPGGATAGSAFTQQPVVKTQDSFGNNSTVGLGASRNVTVAIATGTGTLQGAKTLDIGTGAGNGTISFTDLRIDTAGAKTLSATAASGTPTLAAATSNSFTVSAGAAATIAKTTGDNQSAFINTAYGTALKVTVTDSFGNLVSGATVTFTAPGSGASGTFAGGVNAATTAADGTASAATFTANATVGTYNVSASASGTNTVNFGLTNYGGWAWIANGSAASWTSATGGTNTVNYPGAGASGNLLLLTVVQNGNVTGAATASGWTLLADMKQGSNTRTTVLWRKAGSETSASVVSTKPGSAWITAYARPGNVGPDPTLAGSAAAAGANTSASFSGAPAITTTGANATVISLVGIDTNSTVSIVTANSFTLRGTAQSTASPTTGFALADRFVASTASVTAPTWTGGTSSTDWVGVTAGFN